MKFETDERFADIVFTKEPHFINGTSLIIFVDHDPADNCSSLEIAGIYGVDIINFGEQNVISHAEFSEAKEDHIDLYVEEFKGDGVDIRIPTCTKIPEKVLSVVLVGANGASIYAICESVSKIAKSGDVIYAISARTVKSESTTHPAMPDRP